MSQPRGPQPSETDAHRQWPLAWFGQLPAPARSTFWIATTGWGLDSFDTLAYTFALAAVAATLGMSDAQSGFAATVSLLTGVLGGILAGVLADRIGRVPTFILAVAVYSVFSLLSALAQTYEQLLVCRALLGLGFGGEWTVGAVLVAEMAPPALRGRLQGAFQSAFTVGWGVAALAYFVVFALAPPYVAWRILFALGLLPALLILWARRRLQESPVYRAAATRPTTASKAASAARHASFTQIFGPRLLSTTVAGCLLSAGALSGRYIIAIWLPTYLQSSRGLSAAQSTLQQTTLICASFLGYFAGGALNDSLGRRRTFALTAVASALAIWGYLAVPSGLDALLLAAGLAVGFFTSAGISGLGAYLSELFPTEVRGAGQGFCYSIGRGLSAIFPTVVGVFATGADLAGALAWGPLTYALCLVAVLMLPETRGADLDAPAHATAPARS
jgi:MFS family permease